MGDYTLPVLEGSLTSRGWQPSPPYPADQAHYGIDFAIPVGTPITASAAGAILRTDNEVGGYGNICEVTDRWGTTRYAHLSHFDVTPGQAVVQGQQLGLSGGEAGAPGSGNSTGPHLHFEIRPGGQPVDPAPLLSPPTPTPPAPPSPEEDDEMFTMKCVETDQVAVVTEYRVAAFPTSEWVGRVDVNCTKAELDAEIRERKELATRLGNVTP